ncbi:sodium-dependent phosphate transport protein 2a [Plakobranchus ocellatus]|uniref:Sodium-dependent phosphate transport protein 2a n=1 Tax=Plakobranchus ocellatus TaxID=259542 RepID=A0AAV4D947_9GAST|nr:sodium-dependent phosphate transport protein 2a [Plakobranchus ocellatus]
MDFAEFGPLKILSQQTPTQPKKDETEMNSDEGCVVKLDVSNEVLGLSVLPAPPDLPPQDDLNGMLPLGSGMLLNSHKDSGFSSRVSEVGEETNRSAAAQSLLDQKLARRLVRISECQNEEECKCSPLAVVKVLVKISLVLAFLYAFICLLDLLDNAFRLLGGKTAGSVFQDSELLKNPITGLMIGVLATVILQSSSISSSIVITMVGSKILDLRPAIPIIMGANIGTTVMNTLVSLAHYMHRREFRRAFSGAVVHDVFNWLTVLILLPLEHLTGYLYHLTGLIIDSLNMENVKANKQDLLKKLTKPLTSQIVTVDKKVITGIGQGQEEFKNKSLLKVYCFYDKVTSYQLVNESTVDNETGLPNWTMVNTSFVTKVPVEKCDSLFSKMAWSDTTTGIVLLITSILLLSLCLYSLVKLLNSLLGGQIARALHKTINSDFPRPFGWLTGYAAIVVGAGLTIVVQSSSVFTSALTPLVGVGCLRLERMYPLTLGSNIGTTFTGILAALTSSSSTMHIALQLAFCHLFFNITGILIFYPIPKMRRIIIDTAKYLGRTTAYYRWFAIAYLVCMFILFPGFFFVLSLAGKLVFIMVLCVILALITFVAIVSFMQRSKALHGVLPVCLRNWKFLPKFMRSFEPLDAALRSLGKPLSKCCCCCEQKCSCLASPSEADLGCMDLDSDSEDDMQISYLSSVVSSKINLQLSASCQRGPPKPHRIFSPAKGDPSSQYRKNSVGKKSPSVRRIAYHDADKLFSKCPSLASPSEEDLGCMDLDTDTEDTVQKSHLSSVASSKANLQLSSSCQRGPPEPHGIFDPTGHSSSSQYKKNSVDKESPCVRRVTNKDAGKLFSKCSCLASPSEEDLGCIDLDTDSEDNVQISHFSSFVSSKMNLQLSSSCQQGPPEPDSVFDPAGDNSSSQCQKNSVGTNSPSVRRVTYKDAPQEKVNNSEQQ